MSGKIKFLIIPVIIIFLITNLFLRNSEINKIMDAGFISQEEIKLLSSTFYKNTDELRLTLSKSSIIDNNEYLVFARADYANTNFQWNMLVDDNSLQKSHFSIFESSESVIEGCPIELNNDLIIDEGLIYDGVSVDCSQFDFEQYYDNFVDFEDKVESELKSIK